MTDSAIGNWKPARRHPETYPGDCPNGSYVILDDRVHALTFPSGGGLNGATVAISGREIPLDLILTERGLPTLAGRYPSLAYGANRNPGTLAIKMRNYGYAGLEDGLVLPVLRGITLARDVVACGLSGQGYLYADLLLAEDPVEESRVEAWFPLLDSDQLRVMHDGEHVREGVYAVACFPSRLDGLQTSIHALGYAGNDPIFVSPALDQPLAYSTVRTSQRTLPAMDAVQMLDHVLECGGMRPTAAELSGIVDDDDFARNLMTFMNAGWWIDFRGERQPDARYHELVGMLYKVIEGNQRPHSTAAAMSDRGLVLGVKDAYDPGSARTLAGQLS